ncbi:MAG: PASTA domain-containing protein [Deltaproteobacteria bacterium]|nr:MAG: PASTA domain-containing protein [Deltaproteobacteria bacterium]
MLPGIRLRIAIVAALFLVAGATLLWRAADLQIVQQGRFREMSREQALRRLVLTPPRGRIVDRKGEALAVSVEVDSIRADPSKIRDVPGTARRLAAVLHIDAARLERRLRRGRYFAWVKRRVSPEEARAVRALGLPGIGFTREPRRFYPHRELAAQVLGFAGIDGVGLEGLELALDSALRGTPRLATALRDARGNHLLADPEGADPADLAGGSAELTLDRTLQWIAERALAEGATKAGAKGATAVVLDPHSGEILAMANHPTYNPNQPGRSTKAARRNRAVTDIYEPGSVFKVFTIAAALETGAVAPTERFDCEGGAMRIGGHTIHDSRPHGVLSVTEILKVSSNIGAAKIARRLGKEGLVEALAAFGFGRRTGSGLPGEQPGILRPASSLSEVGLATVSYGQGVSATALQVATALSAIANGGRLMRPFVVARVRNGQGEVIEETRPKQVRRILSPGTARQVARMMEAVVAPGGTGTRARVPGYRVAGKTGTSEKVDPLTRTYSPDKRVASFAGFVPADTPRLVIVVVVDEPQGVKYGGVVAAPIFARIAEESLRYLGVPRQAGASEALLAEAPVAQAEEGGAALPEILAPPPEGKTLVPDLLGLDLRSALRILAERDLDVQIEGTGVVVEQGPHAGAIASPGDVVRLVLGPRT